MSMLNTPTHPEYTVEAISNHMSLRKPQKQSIKILDTILEEIQLGKSGNYLQQQFDIHALYPIFSDFEHEFMSLTFALATGVGKTKLMGAFITYLYTNKGVKNFFVVAPNLTIYSKLKNDLGNPSPENEKYVFRGIGCFATNPPNVWIDDDYRNRPQESTIDSQNSINIYILNISKFNSEERNIMSLNEYLGQSFFDYLKNLDDLVVIMDESHHYRAKSSAAAINDLHPVLGLELTATPQTQQGSKTVLFKNVVYEYPLSAAIRDGYTRTPYAMTRRDIRAYNMTPDELDKTMINDGILQHENMKLELKKYALNNHVKLIKPFMLYQAAQALLKKNCHARGVKSTGIEYFLAGRLYCGQCGRKMVGRSGYGGHNHKKYYYYSCKDTHGKRVCPMKDVPKDLVEESVIRILREKVLLDKGMREYFTDAILGYVNGENPEIPALEKELDELNAKIKKLVLLAEEMDDIEEVAERLKALKSKREGIQENLRLLKHRVSSVDAVDVNSFFDHLASCPFETPEDRRFLVNTFLHKAYVFDDGHITLYLNYRGQISTFMENGRVRMSSPMVHQFVTYMNSLPFNDFEFELCRIQRKNK